MLCVVNRSQCWCSQYVQNSVNMIWKDKREIEVKPPECFTDTCTETQNTKLVAVTFGKIMVIGMSSQWNYWNTLKNKSKKNFFLIAVKKSKFFFKKVVSKFGLLICFKIEDRSNVHVFSSLNFCDKCSCLKSLCQWIAWESNQYITADASILILSYVLINWFLILEFQQLMKYTTNGHYLCLK